MEEYHLRDISYFIYVKPSINEHHFVSILNNHFPEWNTWGLINNLGFDHVLLVRSNIFYVTNEETLIQHLKKDLNSLHIFFSKVKHLSIFEVQVEIKFSRFNLKSTSPRPTNTWSIDSELLALIDALDAELIFI